MLAGVEEGTRESLREAVNILGISDLPPSRCTSGCDAVPFVFLTKLLCFFSLLFMFLFSELGHFIYKGEEKEEAVYETLTTALVERLKTLNNAMPK